MLIAQASDIHLGFQPDDPAELNRKRFEEVLVALVALDPQPEVLLLTGDLTESGSTAAYRALKGLCDALPFPVLPAVGPHDDRANFCSVFTHTPRPGGFVQYVHDAGPIRIIVIDTVDPGRQGGAFDMHRAAWLSARLSLYGGPTIVVLHHPPIISGNGLMTEAIDAPWVRRLHGVIADNPHVIRLIAGHLHRPLVTSFGGSLLTVCPSTAPQFALDFRPLDPETPDGRELIVAEAPGFALHYWNGYDLVTHFGCGGDRPVFARFNARMQPMVRRVLSENPG